MALTLETTDKTYTGDGSTTTFDLVCRVIDETKDLKITLTEIATEVETIGVYDTDYTVVNLNNDETGVRVTYPKTGDAISSAFKLTVERDVGYLQKATINDQGFYPSTVETLLDLLTMQTQQLAGLMDRALVFKVSSSSTGITVPDPEANKMLGWDATLTKLVNLAAVNATVTSFMATVLDDANAAEALTTLGVTAFAQTILDDANAAEALATLGVTTFSQTLLDDANATTALATLGAEAANAEILKANVTDVLTKGFATTAVALSGTSVTPGLTLANVFTWPITGNSTLNNPTVTGAGVWYIYATVNATGGYTMSFGANFNTISGTFDGTANAVNRFTITSDGTAFDLNIDQRV